MSVQSIEVDPSTRAQINEHYQECTDTYEKIWSKLDLIQEKFQSASADNRITYLKLSYINSVLSIRTPAERQEKAIDRLISEEPTAQVFEPVLYHNAKRTAIQKTLSDEPVWEDLVRAMRNQNIDRSVEIAVDRLKYIGTVKGPFLFAMIGFTGQMCIDSNLAQILGMDRSPQIEDANRYNQLCKKVYMEFPKLNGTLDPFHLQWVIFDWQRSYGEENITQIQVESDVMSHEKWFDAVFQSPSKIDRAVSSIE